MASLGRRILGADRVCMAGFAGVLVIHGKKSEPIAIRLAMDLRSDGIPAHPAALEKIGPSDWQQGLPGVTGLVVIYDGQTWITADVEAPSVRCTPPALSFSREAGPVVSTQTFSGST
jgi:hypothetical protein